MDTSDRYSYGLGYSEFSWSKDFEIIYFYVVLQFSHTAQLTARKDYWAERPGHDGVFVAGRRRHWREIS